MPNAQDYKPQQALYDKTKGQRHLAKVAPNDPAQTARGVYCTRCRRFKLRDRQTDRQTDTANIGNNSQRLMHTMQPKTS